MSDFNDDGDDRVRSSYGQLEDNISHACKRLENVDLNDGAGYDDNDQCADDDKDDESGDDRDDVDDSDDNDEEKKEEEEEEEEDFRNRMVTKHRSLSRRETNPPSKTSQKGGTSDKSKKDKGIYQNPIESSREESEASVSNDIKRTTKQRLLDSPRRNLEESEVRYVSNSRKMLLGGLNESRKHKNGVEERINSEMKKKSEAFQSANGSSLGSKVLNKTDSITKSDGVDSCASSRSLVNDVENSEGDTKMKRCVENVRRTLLEWCSDETRNYCLTFLQQEAHKYKSGEKTNVKFVHCVLGSDNKLTFTNLKSVETVSESW